MKRTQITHLKSNVSNLTSHISNLMNHISLLISLLLFCQIGYAQDNKHAVNTVMDNWHKAAADAKFDTYFGLMDDESIFIGTDATERWDKKAFMAYAKPHFDRGRAWSFTSLERFVNFSKDGKTAWIDELLNTQMKICRGSGVLEFKNGKWLIKHYVLAMTIPNDFVDKITPLKAPIEDKLIDSLKRK